MQLPDEAIAYNYQSLLAPVGEEWNAAAELRARHFLSPARLKELTPRLMQCRSQVAAERELRNVPPEMQPLDAGFIDLPQATLDNHRRKGDASDLGRISEPGQPPARRGRSRRRPRHRRPRAGPARPLRGLVQPLPQRTAARNAPGMPRVYFEGNNADNDALQDLLDLCRSPASIPTSARSAGRSSRSARPATPWNPASPYRVFRREAAEYYGLRSEWLKELFVAVTGDDSELRKLCQADGHDEQTILTIPDNIGGRFSVFTAAGLLAGRGHGAGRAGPAARRGHDDASASSKSRSSATRSCSSPAVNYLMAEEHGKPLRVLSVWSKKLEALGQWYDQLLSESLGKQGRGPTPLTTVGTRDLHVRGQQHQEGMRDSTINNLVVKNPKAVPIIVRWPTTTRTT